MPLRLPRGLSLLLAGSLATGAAAAGVSAPPGMALFRPGDTGSRCFRIPSLVSTLRGTLVAVADRRPDGPADLPAHIGLAARRSTDGGRTWSPARVVVDLPAPDGASDAAAVVDRATGRVFVAFTIGHDAGIAEAGPGLTGRTAVPHLIVSDDDGVTWSAPIDLGPQVKAPEFRWMGFGPGAGSCHEDGTLTFSCYASATGVPDLFSFAIVSDDHGRTWRRSAHCSSFTCESQMVALGDGRWMACARDRRQGGARLVALSTDRGATWSPAAREPRLPCPGCQAGLIRITHPNARRGLLVYTGPEGPATGRARGVVRVSDDAAATWRFSTVVVPGSFGYSTPALLADGRVGLVFEHDGEVRFLALDLGALTSGVYPSSPLSRQR